MFPLCVPNWFDPAHSVHHFPRMQTITSVTAMQRAAWNWRKAATRVALVPTMGYLHAGHLSLVERARQSVGPRGKVVVSIYVNPTQFGPKEDFSRYPRDLKRDAQLCRQAGVDVIFAPRDPDMYPRDEDRAHSTFVVEESLSRSMEGAARPTHFRGVTTVVAKLFNLVQPACAIFGAKDFQQVAVVQRMVRDLNFPLEIIVAPTLRELDGLAMSSRNKYLEGELRQQALVLSESIALARKAVNGSPKGVAASRLRSQVEAHIRTAPQARLDYVEFFNPETLTPMSKVTGGTQMALAVVVGKTRLIDNGAL